MCSRVSGSKREDLAAAQQRRVDREERVLRRRPDQDDDAVLDVRQQHVLLGLVEAVDLVEEQDRPLAVGLRGRARASASTSRTSLMPAATALSGAKRLLVWLGDDVGQRRLAGAGRAVEDQRAEPVGLRASGAAACPRRGSAPGRRTRRASAAASGRPAAGPAPGGSARSSSNRSMRNPRGDPVSDHTPGAVVCGRSVPATSSCPAAGSRSVSTRTAFLNAVRSSPALSRSAFATLSDQLRRDGERLPRCVGRAAETSTLNFRASVQGGRRPCSCVAGREPRLGQLGVGVPDPPSQLGRRARLWAWVGPARRGRDLTTAP